MFWRADTSVRPYGAWGGAAYGGPSGRPVPTRVHLDLRDGRRMGAGEDLQKPLRQKTKIFATSPLAGEAREVGACYLPQ